ncbi:MAG: hypothetical protein ACREAE_09180 [Nitrosopumilaceae archaeon]
MTTIHFPEEKEFAFSCLVEPKFMKRDYLHILTRKSAVMLANGFNAGNQFSDRFSERTQKL